MYKPETAWRVDGAFVYNLKQDGWRKGKPRMVNDLTVSIECTNTDHTRNMALTKEAAEVIATALNRHFFHEESESNHG